MPEKFPTTGSGKGSARRSYNPKKYKEGYESIEWKKKEKKKKK